MASSIADKKIRLRKFLPAILDGRRGIKGINDAKLFLEAIVNEEERERCIERIVASSHGLQALRASLRCDCSSSFVVNFCSPFLDYITGEGVKQLHGGQLLRDVLSVIVDPPTFWKALETCYSQHALPPDAIRGFAWLLFELLTAPTSFTQLPVRRIAEDLAPSFGSSPDFGTRSVAYRIQDVLRSTATVSMSSAGTKPGGRHDNDFEDFRRIAIFPTADELLAKDLPFYLPADAVQETPADKRIAAHLDNQFRLVREEMLHELRNDIQPARGTKQGKRNSNRLSELVFDHIDCGDPENQRSRPALLALRCYKGIKVPPGDEKGRQKYFTDNKHILKHESFGCLIHRGEIVAFATTGRNEEMLARDPPILLLRIFGTSALVKTFIALKTFHHRELEFVMVDTPFFAFEPILRSLQEKQSIPLSDELLKLSDYTAMRESPVFPRALVKRIGEGEGSDLRDVLGVQGQVMLDTSQTASLISGLSQPVSLIQGPPGTGKSFLGSLLAKTLFDHSCETILVICYTNHALDQFLTDIRKMGVSDADMLRLGSKPSLKTKHLGLHEQPRSYRRTRISYDLMHNYETKMKGEQRNVKQNSSRFRHLTMSKSDILDFLQFSDADSDFHDALSVPEGDDENMTMIGKGGKAINSSYLLERWMAGKDAGIFQDRVQDFHRHIWTMREDAREEYVRKWTLGFYLEQATVLQNSIDTYNTAFDKFRIVRDERFVEIIKNKRVIGCTTSAAARYRRELTNANPGIILVEEAGEILESHVLSALCSNTKHLVLIGDHQQLRPKVNNWQLTVEKGDGFDLNVSLFERLIMAGYPHTTLAKQHRMRPEISVLVRRLMYPDLQDDAKTMSRPNIRGLQSNVIFWDHTHPEVEMDSISDQRDGGSKISRHNHFEANMVLKTIRYLAQQGYGTDQQVVLTPYLGQLRLLLSHLSSEHDPVLNDLDSFELVRAGLLEPASASTGKKRIRISTIDNYQGEESDIVIASLTRSNNNRDIGFMAAPQRTNVLLSRARNGLILIGNKSTFLSSKRGRETWEPIVEQLSRSGHLFDGLPVRCERHPEKTAVLSRAEDFESECPDGGCSQPCHFMLNCGKHACPQRCHQLSDHTKMKCLTIMDNTCPIGHTYRSYCWQKSPTCKKCEDEATKREAQRQRDHQLDLKRQTKERLYAARLLELDNEIAHERRLQREEGEEESREHTLSQREKDLANVREGRRRTQKSEDPSPTTTKTSPSEIHGTPPAEARPPTDHETEVFDDSRVSSSTMTEWKYQKDFEMAKNEHLDELMEMIGLESVKETILDIKTKIDTCIRQNANLRNERFGAVLLGNPGTGKTTVARIYAKFLASLGVLPGTLVEETTGSRLAANGVKACESLIQKVLNAGGGAIFIDEAYQLASETNLGGAQVLDFLLAEVENLTGKVVFILAGYRKPMEKFFAHNPGLPSRFPQELRFDDYEDGELRRILEFQVKKQFKGRMRAEQGLDGLFCWIVARRVGYGRGHEGFGNARAVENAFSSIRSRQAARLRRERRAGGKPDDFLLTRDDLLGPEPSNVLEKNSSWKKLKSLIGLASVKQSVKAIFESIQFNYERELAEKPLLKFNLNKVFLGSPGTGKTTVAKLYGQILADIGLLSNGEVVVKNPSDFVGDVLGASEKTTKGILAATIGKVLVIDEAYGLHGSGGSKMASDPYKAAVIDTIVAEVQSVPGDDRCVILIGYKDQMEAMFQDVNPGLSRRFPLSEAFHFEDFTDDELKQVLVQKLKEQAYGVTDQAMRVCIDVLKRARNQKHFGNAGAVDILLNEAKARHQQRRSAKTSKATATLEAIDIDPNFNRTSRPKTDVRLLFAGEVGREEIIKQLEGYRLTVANMEARGLDPRQQIPFNFLFRGPPGTGKTTTARKMGKVYYDMGFLASAEVLEISATDIVGEYVGHTGPKAKAQLERALGKVLFVDEAYRLAQGQFAKEAMDEIVDCLTKPMFAQKMIVILAGYDSDINRLMTINPGLTSRFPDTMNFTSLSSVQCLELLVKQLRNSRPLDVTPLDASDTSFKQHALGLFERLVNTLNWGNARDVALLAKAIYGSLLKAADPNSREPILVYPHSVHAALDEMVSERGGRSSFREVLPIAQDMPELSTNSAPQSTSFELKATKSQHTDSTIETTERLEAASKLQEDESSADVADPSRPDLGVTEEIWAQLQQDKQATMAADRDRLAIETELRNVEKEAEVYEEECRKEELSRLSKDQQEANHRLEQELLARETERRKRHEKLAKLERERQKAVEAHREELAAQRKLRQMGVCVAGFRWIKQDGGYRCAGGTHYVSDSQLGST